MSSIHAQQLEDLHFRVLQLLQRQPDISQRDLAAQLGVSHGKMNYCMNALMAKGLVKLDNFQNSQHKFKYVYLLTPAGLAEKAALTGRFLKRKMAEYEALSGHKLDQKRVNYYRVNACVLLAAGGSGPHGGFGLAPMSPARTASEEKVSADADRAADGSAFIFTTLHRRMRLEALGAAMGLDLSSRQLSVQSADLEVGLLYDQVLETLRDASGRISDRPAQAQVKGVARIIKYLKESAAFSARFAADELEVISQILGRRPDSLEAGRLALYAEAEARRIPDEAYIRYHWERLIRDDFLMRTAAGAVYQRTWPDIFKTT